MLLRAVERQEDEKTLGIHLDRGNDCVHIIEDDGTDNEQLG